MGSWKPLPVVLFVVVCLAALNVWQFVGRPSSWPSDRQVLNQFYEIWTNDPETWRRNRWFGIPTQQNPFDVWITQEIIWELKPDLLVEAGTFRGGSAALWATILQQANPGARVVTIDIEDRTVEARRLDIVQRHVDFLHGSSTAPDIVAKVSEMTAGKSTLVILDSMHTRDHVLAELRAYAPLIPLGGYIIVQDGMLNGHPVWPNWGPGPYEAIADFLSETDDFEVDRSRERLRFTYNPNGFLKRVRGRP